MEEIKRGRIVKKQIVACPFPGLELKRLWINGTVVDIINEWTVIVEWLDSGTPELRAEKIENISLI